MVPPAAGRSRISPPAASPVTLLAGFSIFNFVLFHHQRILMNCGEEWTDISEVQRYDHSRYYHRPDFAHLYYAMLPRSARPDRLYCEMLMRAQETPRGRAKTCWAAAVAKMLIGKATYDRGTGYVYPERMSAELLARFLRFSARPLQ